MTKWFNLLWKTVFRICGLLLVVLLLLYVFLYIIVPHYYYATAHADVDHKMEQFCEKIKGSTLKYAKEQVDLFESDDNLDVGIVDQGAAQGESLLETGQRCDVVGEGTAGYII